MMFGQLCSGWTSASLVCVVLAGCQPDSVASVPTTMAPASGGVSDADPLLPGQTGGLAATGGLAPQGSGGDGATPSVTTGGQSSGSGGTGGSATETGGSTSVTSYDYENEQVELTMDLVILPGETLRVGPGTSFKASAGVSIIVQGTLVVEGTDTAPASFAGAGTPRSWQGIVVESGGQVDLSQLTVNDANYGLHAKPGSTYSIDHAEMGNSFKTTVLEADGSVSNSRFHGTDGFGFAPVNEVSIADVNGTMTIINASPTVTNSRFDGGSALVDMIRVGGDSSPVFDHIYVTTAHCGIHANGGVNTGLTVRNSVFEGMSFGLMIYTTAPRIEDSVFMGNATDFGFCFGATDQNRPNLTNNYYSDGAPLVDATCFQIGVTEASPASSANPNAGPSGL